MSSHAPDARWQAFFMDVAKRCAQMSRDPRTKVGAVIVRPNKTILSTGFNGFPRMVCDDPAVYADRDEKLRRVVHAELNAILTAPERPVDCTIYSTHMPCARCAAAIIQAGISTVVCPEPDAEFALRWREDIIASRDMLAQAGVVIHTGGVPPEPLQPNVVSLAEIASQRRKDK